MYDYYDNQEFDNFQKTQAEQEEFERYVSDEAQMRWEYEMDAYFNELYQKEQKENKTAQVFYAWTKKQKYIKGGLNYFI